MRSTEIRARIITVMLPVFTIFLLVACKEGNKREFPPLPKENGKVLYEFLLKEAPDLVAQIPCSCCGEMLDWCYKGGCPFT
ncbi:MAG: hypothetical protein JRE28_16285 [Deltaproteobacteria bacterium]|nr:hypothetical protein [Deltaproteobacteria bacterium]